MDKKLVYFLCTGNSCRSQIADGFLKALGGDQYEVKSAGLEAHGLNPRAVTVMNEAGVDISNHTSDVIDQDTLSKADYIITLCGHANDNCPIVQNDKAERWHWGFDDPAQATGTEEEIMKKFREVRDAIKNRIEQFVKQGKYSSGNEEKSTVEKKYHSLLDNKIFMGGASDVEQMVKNEQVEVVVDLREEATECAYPNENVKWIKVPIGDNTEKTNEELFQQAIDHVVNAYKDRKKVAFHCGGGKGRTGAVAIGTLIALAKYNTIEEAERAAKEIRPVINIREPQRKALEMLYK